MNWRSSAFNGGSPGTADAATFSQWLATSGISDLTGLGDQDNDGLEDLLEYALGLNPLNRNLSGVTTGTTTILGQDYMTLTLSYPMGLDEISYTGQASLTPQSWSPAVLLSTTRNFITGQTTSTWRHFNPISSDLKQFMRVHISK
jgi:hypothetical protein